jgi:hypothetical protein
MEFGILTADDGLPGNLVWERKMGFGQEEWYLRST